MPRIVEHIFRLLRPQHLLRTIQKRITEVQILPLPQFHSGAAFVTIKGQCLKVGGPPYGSRAGTHEIDAVLFAPLKEGGIKQQLGCGTVIHAAFKRPGRFWTE